MPSMMGIFSILPYYLNLGYGVWKIENSCKSKNTGVVKSLKEIKKKQDKRIILYVVQCNYIKGNYNFIVTNVFDDIVHRVNFSYQQNKYKPAD